VFFPSSLALCAAAGHGAHAPAFTALTLLASGTEPRCRNSRMLVPLWRVCATYGMNERNGEIPSEKGVILRVEMNKLSIAVASDHAGYDLKVAVKQQLAAMGYEVVDLGTNGTQSVDYPDFAYAVAHALRDGRVDRGVLICGSGIGISIAANRYPEVRAALVHDALSARLARQHNDANVICFGGRMIGADVAGDCLKVFLETAFEGGRHAARIEKLKNPL
jgi:ribose 5-phosphate isomerase B